MNNSKNEKTRVRVCILDEHGNKLHELLTLQEYADSIGLSYYGVYKQLRQGKIKTITKVVGEGRPIHFVLPKNYNNN